MRFLGGKTRKDFEEMAKKNSELEEAYDVLDKLSADEDVYKRQVLFCSKVFKQNRIYFLTVHGIHKTVNRIHGKHSNFHETLEEILLKDVYKRQDLFTGIVSVNAEIQLTFQRQH